MMNMKSRIPAIVYVKGFAIKSFGHAAVKKTQGRGLVTPAPIRLERVKNKNLQMITYYITIKIIMRGEEPSRQKWPLGQAI